MVFWRQPDPIATYFTALQRWFGTPESGRWDPATHDALLRFVHEYDPLVPPEAPWGGDPAMVARWVTEIVDAGAEDESLWVRMQGLYASLGFPSADFRVFRAYAEDLSSAERSLIDDVERRIQQAVVTAEKEAPPGQGSGTQDGVVPSEEAGRQAMPPGVGGDTGDGAATADPTAAQSGTLDVSKPPPALGTRWRKLSTGRKAALVGVGLAVLGALGYGGWRLYRSYSAGTHGLGGLGGCESECTRRCRRTERRRSAKRWQE